MSLLLSFLTGAGLKLIVGIFNKAMDLRREKDLLLAMADIDTITALQSGQDTLSPWGKITRRILAFTVVGTFCFLVVFHVVWRPEQTYSILIDKNPSLLFGWMIGTVDKATIEVSAGSLLWNFEHFVAFIIPFYFTKMAKGG